MHRPGAPEFPEILNTPIAVHVFSSLSLYIQPRDLGNCRAVGTDPVIRNASAIMGWDRLHIPRNGKPLTSQCVSFPPDVAPDHRAHRKRRHEDFPAATTGGAAIGLAFEVGCAFR